MRRSIATYLLISLLSIALTLFLVEIAIRVVSPQSLYGGGISYQDPNFFDIKPNFHGSFSHPDYTYFANTDNNRLRLTTTSQSSNADLTVLVLGDSFTFGIGVDDKETFASQIGDLLVLRGIKARVYNAGSPAYTLSETFCKFKRLKDIIKPDLVIIVGCDNDFVANKISCPSIGTDSLITKNNAPRRVQSLWLNLYPYIRDSLLSHSHLAVMLSFRINEILVRYNLRGSFTSVSAPYDPQSYISDKERTDHVKFILNDFIELLNKDSIQSVFVYIPGILEVDDLLWSAVESANRGLNRTLPRKFLLERAQKANFDTVIDLKEIFSNQDKRAIDYYFPLDMHLNELGNNFLATVVVDHISRKLSSKVVLGNE